MAAVVTLHPLDTRGVEILDEMERTVDVVGEMLGDGTRRYHLIQSQADIRAFEPMLDALGRDWREHIVNTTPE